MKAVGVKKQIYNYIWPKLSYAKLKLRFSKPANCACLKSIEQQISENAFDSEQHRINFIRNWVNSNSVHLIDDEHDSYAFDVVLVLYKLNSFARSKGLKPHLSCGPRAYAMKAILDHMKIQSRIIDLFGLTELDNGKLKVSPHTLIEVFNRDSQKWVLQDPDFNVAYANAKTGEYLSAKEMLLAEKAERHFDSAGYAIESPVNLQNTVDGLFEWGVLYRYSYEGLKSLLVYTSDQYFNMKVGDSESLQSFIMHRSFNLKSVKV